MLYRTLLTTALARPAAATTLRRTSQFIKPQIALSSSLLRSYGTAHGHIEVPIIDLEVRRNDQGEWLGTIGGEEVVFPEQQATLEWVLPTPVPQHLFAELPVIKETPEDETEEEH